VSDVLADRVIAAIARAQHLPRESVTLDSTFDDLRIDSLAAVSVVCDLENEFDISVPNDEVVGLRTVRDVVDALARHLRRAGEAPRSEAPRSGVGADPRLATGG
jgi:acyl carrier protein